MEVVLKKALGTATLTPTGRGGGGCINQGEAYMVDLGTVFVKSNPKKNSKLMFDGELEGLKAIAATDTLQVPAPIVAVNNPNGGAALVLEYLDMKSLRSFSKDLGKDLARMHLCNKENMERQEKQDTYVGSSEKEAADNEGTTTLPSISKFGFHVPTCCGYIPMNNTWQDEWMTFFARNRLEHQIKLIEKDFGDREVMELWSHLKIKLPEFFSGLNIFPSLLHGDLWSGNVAETFSRPVVFDPAAFYGHHEYDLAIASMFGGFNQTFYNEYHKLIPETPGSSRRIELYKLFHYLNHWNHFGTGYKSSSIKLLKLLVQ